MKKSLFTLLTGLLILSAPAHARSKMNFNDVDVNKDKQVTLLEMQNAAQKRLLKADKNKDRIIEVDEVLSLMPFFVQGHAKPEVVKFLKERDLNQDGKTKLSEVKEHIARRFKTLDTNGDGHLSEAEFQAGNKK